MTIALTERQVEVLRWISTFTTTKATEALRSRAIVITETGAAVLRGEAVILTHHARRCSCGSVLEKRQRSLCIPCRIKADETKRVAALVPKGDEPSPMSQRIEAALAEAERCVERVAAATARAR